MTLLVQIELRPVARLGNTSSHADGEMETKRFHSIGPWQTVFQQRGRCLASGPKSFAAWVNAMAEQVLCGKNRTAAESPLKHPIHDQHWGNIDQNTRHTEHTHIAHAHRHRAALSKASRSSLEPARSLYPAAHGATDVCATTRRR